MGRKLRLWILLAAAVFITAVLPQRVQAEDDPEMITFKLDCCEGHEDIAEIIAGNDNCRRDGTVVWITLYKDVLNLDWGYIDNGSIGAAVNVLDDRLRTILSGTVIHNGQKLYNNRVGLKELSKYSNSTELSEDLRSNEPAKDNMTFYLLWEQPVGSIKVTIEPPECGVEVKMYDDIYDHCGHTNYPGHSPHTHPWPEITIEGHAHLFSDPYHGGSEVDGVWTDNKEGIYSWDKIPQYGYLETTFEGGKSYWAAFSLEADFGYWLKVTESTDIIVNGKAPVTYTPKIVAEIQAEHIPGDNLISEQPSCETDGKEPGYICQGCGKKIDAKTIPALGHAWKFTGFTWTGTEKNGYTKAVAEYVCEHDKTHTKTVDAEIKETVTAPGCLTKGKSTFTVSVSAQKSPDGKAHSESKEGRPTEAAGHTWKAPIFTWTTDGQGGYSGAEATFVCKKDSAHKVSVKAEVTSRKVKSKCEAAGMTIYTATVPAKASPDGKEYTDQAGAEITDPTGHTWEFVGFTWTGNQAKGYTKATANYVCRRDPLHKYSVKAMITKKVTAPTKEKDGRTVYTAKVSETKSPDGKKHSETKNGPATVWKASGLLFAKLTAKGDTSLKITWNKIKGVGGYDIFLSKCKSGNKKAASAKIKTIKGNKTFRYTKKKLKEATDYKVYVKAWIKKNGKKKYVKTSSTVHAYTAAGTAEYTNTRGVKLKKSKITLKKGKKYTIEATPVRLDSKKALSKHMSGMTYKSSNSKIASVSKKGKVTAKKAGSCKIYVIAANGAKKAMTVKVK